MDGLGSYTELLSRFGAPASTLFAGTSYGIDGAGGSIHGFTGSDTSYGIDDGVGCGGDCYFEDGASVSSASGLSSDSSDPEEEDGRDEMDWTVNLDGAEDLPFDEQAHIPDSGHYGTACEELAEEMRDAAATSPPSLFVPRGNGFYIKRFPLTGMAWTTKKMLARMLWINFIFVVDEDDGQVADNMIGGGFEFEAVEVQLDDGDSYSGAELQAVDVADNMFCPFSTKEPLSFCTDFCFRQVVLIFAKLIVSQRSTIV